MQYWGLHIGAVAVHDENRYVTPLHVICNRCLLRLSNFAFAICVWSLSWMQKELQEKTLIAFGTHEGGGQAGCGVRLNQDRPGQPERRIASP